MNDVTMVKLADALDSVNLCIHRAAQECDWTVYNDLQVAADVLKAASAVKESGKYEMQTV